MILKHTLDAALILAFAFLFVPPYWPASAEPGRSSSRIVTSSDDLKITKADHAIGMKRTDTVHPTIALLPDDADPDQEFVIDDLADNFRAAPVTVITREGQSIRGLRSYTLDLSNSHTTFRYFGDGIWSIER